MPRAVLPFWMRCASSGVSRLAPHRVRAVAATTLAASITALGLQIAIGAVWVAKAEHVATAGLAHAGGRVDVGARDVPLVGEVTREPFAASI